MTTGTQIDLCLSDDDIIVMANNNKNNVVADVDVEDGEMNPKPEVAKRKPRRPKLFCPSFLSTCFLLAALLLIALGLAALRSADWAGLNVFGPCSSTWLKLTWTNGPPPT